MPWLAFELQASWLPGLTTETKLSREVDGWCCNFVKANTIHNHKFYVYQEKCFPLENDIALNALRNQKKCYLDNRWILSRTNCLTVSSTLLHSSVLSYPIPTGWTRHILIISGTNTTELTEPMARLSPLLNRDSSIPPISYYAWEFFGSHNE